MIGFISDSWASCSLSRLSKLTSTIEHSHHRRCRRAQTPCTRHCSVVAGWQIRRWMSCLPASTAVASGRRTWRLSRRCCLHRNCSAAHDTAQSGIRIWHISNRVTRLNWTFMAQGQTDSHLSKLQIADSEKDSCTVSLLQMMEKVQGSVYTHIIRQQRLSEMVNRTTSYKEEILVNVGLYKTLARPYLEYCGSAWSPHYVKHKETIDMLNETWNWIGHLGGFSYAAPGFLLCGGSVEAKPRA